MDVYLCCTTEKNALDALEINLIWFDCTS
jgi:hypothetical protein